MIINVKNFLDNGCILRNLKHDTIFFKAGNYYWMEKSDWPALHNIGNTVLNILSKHMAAAPENFQIN